MQWWHCLVSSSLVALSAIRLIDILFLWQNLCRDILWSKGETKMEGIYFQDWDCIKTKSDSSTTADWMQFRLSDHDASHEMSHLGKWQGGGTPWCIWLKASFDRGLHQKGRGPHQRTHHDFTMQICRVGYLDFQSHVIISTRFFRCFAGGWNVEAISSSRSLAWKIVFFWTAINCVTFMWQI